MSYIDDIHRITNLTINEIIRISNKYVPNRYKLEPWKYMDGQGRTLEHGTAVLKTEEQCCAYMSAYGPMHRHKLMRALDEKEFPYSNIKYIDNQLVTVIKIQMICKCKYKTI